MIDLTPRKMPDHEWESIKNRARRSGRGTWAEWDRLDLVQHILALKEERK